jgi:membrane-bound lytic murein transglycosylase D
MGRNLFWRSALILLVFSVKLSAQEGLPTTGWPWGQTTIEESLIPRSSAPASSSIEIPYSNPPREEVYQELPVNEMQETEKSPIAITRHNQGLSPDFPIPSSLAWQASLDLPDHPRIDYYEKQYLPGGAGYLHLKRTLQRGKPYLRFIYTKAVEYGVPTELMWLPAIESSFIGHAGSHAGAKGLWQFMLNSITPEMRVDSWRDDRLDFWLATEAAFFKLRYNYNLLGDWALSLAAYNAGMGRMNRLLRTYGGDYWSLLAGNRLPRETSQYVPKFFALIRVLRNAERNGLDFGWDLPQEMEEWTRIPLGSKQVDLHLLAGHTGIAATKLRSWNLELRNRVTPPSGYSLKVPRRHEEIVRSVLNNPALASMRYYRYEVKQGDTISELADYYGISQGLINRYNPSVHGANIRIGQILLIPSVKDVPPFPARATGVRVAAADSGRRHEVVDGDTLWSLSQRFETTVDAIKELNNLSTNGILKIGMSLKIPL